MTTTTMFTIDTLRFAKKLEKSGMNKETAETLASEIKDAQVQSYDILATKRDIADLRNEIKIAMLTTIISLGGIVTLAAKFIH